MRPKTSQDVRGASELHGVQGVAGSNPAVPTILIPKDLRAADIGGFFVIGHVFGHMCHWPRPDCFRTAGRQSFETREAAGQGTGPQCG